MLNYGHITKTTDAKKPFVGEIRCRMLRGKVTMVPAKKLRETAPDFKVYIDGDEFGAAWRKATRETGEEFFSITLDSPDMVAPLNLTAFANSETDGKYDLVWQRPRQDGQRAKTSKAVDNGQSEESAAA